MYGLPQTTDVKKQLPKKTIYTKFELKPSQRESFDADVARIDIVAVVSPKTVPAIKAGEDIKEFYLLAVQLKRKNYDAKNIALLSKLIPQNILFALHFNDEVQFAVHHTKLICSVWHSLTSPSSLITLTGLNFDAVWENIIKSIGQIDIEDGHTLTEQIKADDERAKIEKQIALLERKMAAEKQPRRKRELFEQIKELRKKNIV